MIPVKVLVVDDHPLARRGVGSLLAEAFPDLELREAGTTTEAIKIATSFQPNLVVLDLRTPDPPGPAATCAVLKERNKRGYIVILTAFAEMDLIRQCLAAGADGVLLWVGGMLFVLSFLRPALAVLAPPERLALMRP